MPDADTVWLTPLPEMLTYLERAGLRVRWQEDYSLSHLAAAESLIDAFAADASAIAEQVGHRALEELLAAHRLWSEWLREGRVRKVALVAEKGGDASLSITFLSPENGEVILDARDCHVRRGRCPRRGCTGCAAGRTG
jgi:hypothetical protein